MSPSLAPAEGKFWMDEVHRVRFGEDEDAIRDQNALFARLADAKAERDAAARPSRASRRTSRPSVRAAKLMIENQSLPVLFRRDIQRALENSIDITRGRIYMGRVARRINLCPNPLVFTTTGRPSQALDHLTHERFPHVPTAYEIVCDPAAPEGPMLHVAQSQHDEVGSHSRVERPPAGAHDATGSWASCSSATRPAACWFG